MLASASRVTAVFDHNKGDFDDDVKRLLAKGDDPFSFDGLRFTSSFEESQKLRREARRALVVASSGMAQSGRIRAWLEAFLPNPSTHVVIVGFQAQGTIGRRLVEGAKVLRMGGREVPVNATVHTHPRPGTIGRPSISPWVSHGTIARSREPRALDPTAT